LRQALNVFARDGIKGVATEGFADGLPGYMRRAAAQTEGLRSAIRDGQFDMLYQPIVAFADGTTHHYEALIRPKPIKDATFRSPQDFVMLIEALGLADELDIAVARLACDAAEAAGKSVAFNLSGQSVQCPAFRAQLTELLTASPARKRGLVLVEMTETAEIQDVEETIRTADALRALGVPFCLDDFGAGAADLRLLRTLSADIVKLDGSYIAGVTESGRERAFIAGMAEIARASGAAVVAERVETQAEADVLRELGVQYGQGWFFGRPAALPSARPSVLAAVTAAANAIYEESRPGAVKQPVAG
jgi:EAL domain-containing protein (putative c-di-GMP-specific phosphodiesterase class I)